MLMRTDPFRELDRFIQQPLGSAARPVAVPMDAWRDGDEFIVELDLPGVDVDSLQLDIEHNVVTVRAHRAAAPSREMLAAERPRGQFFRQLTLGDTLDTARIAADYHDGVLRLVIPVAERAKPRRISVNRSSAIVDDATEITKSAAAGSNSGSAEEPVRA